MLLFDWSVCNSGEARHDWCEESRWIRGEMYEFWWWVRLHTRLWISCRTGSSFFAFGFLFLTPSKVILFLLFLTNFQIYCCVGVLSITHCLHYLNPDLLGWWLCERQLPSGGLNGRPEKLPDVCYSWWVLASLRILGKIDWIDKVAWLCPKLSFKVWLPRSQIIQFSFWSVKSNRVMIFEAHNSTVFLS